MKLFLSFFLFFSLNSFADSERYFLSPFHLAYGNAGVASLQADFAYIINPAILGFYRQSQMGGAYYARKNSNGETLKKTLVSFADKNSIVPMGVTYERNFEKDLISVTQEKWEASVGFLFQRFLSLGASVQKTKKPEEDFHLWEVKAGGILKLKQNLHFGFTAENLKAYAASSRNKPNLRLGVHYNWSHVLNMRADLNYAKLKAHSVSAGTEFFIKRFIALRFGGEWVRSSLTKEVDDVFLGFGLGFTSPRLRIDMAYSTPSLTKNNSVLNVKDYAITASFIF